MKETFNAEVHQLDDACFVRISGTIDEDNALASLVGHIRGAVAMIDLSGVSEINTCGVRDWVRWRESVHERSEVVLIACAPTIVAQLNLVANFAGNAVVKSLHLPYFCNHCNAEKTRLVELIQLTMLDPPSAPTARCDSCHALMAFDDLEESYFAFTERVNRELPKDIAAIVARALPEALERAAATNTSAPGPAYVAGSGASKTSVGVTVSGYSLSSAAALRRLREKTGIRTHRAAAQSSKTDTAPPPPAAEPRRHRWKFTIMALSLVCAAAGIAIAWVFARS